MDDSMDPDDSLSSPNAKDEAPANSSQRPLDRSRITTTKACFAIHHARPLETEGLVMNIQQRESQLNWLQPEVDGSDPATAVI